MDVLRFLLIRDVREQLPRHLVFTQLLIHANQQPLGCGVHVAHFYPSLVVEEDVVALAGGIDAHVKLLLLRPAERDTDTQFRHVHRSLCTVTPKFFSPRQCGLQLNHTAVRSTHCSTGNIFLPA